MSEAQAPPSTTFGDTTEIKATDLRTSTRSILERAKFQGERFVVYTYRQPMAVLIGVDEYLRLADLSHEDEE